MVLPPSLPIACHGSNIQSSKARDSRDGGLGREDVASTQSPSSLDTGLTRWWDALLWFPSLEAPEVAQGSWPSACHLVSQLRVSPTVHAATRKGQAHGQIGTDRQRSLDRVCTGALSHPEPRSAAWVCLIRGWVCCFKASKHLLGRSPNAGGK